MRKTNGPTWATAVIWQTFSQSEPWLVLQQSWPPGAEKLGPAEGTADFICIWQDGVFATSGLTCRAWQG